MVHLPMLIADIIDVDAMIVTHLHESHWDQAARDAQPKDLPVFAQNNADAEATCGQDSTDVRVLSGNSELEGVRLIKTAGRNGTEARHEVIAESWARSASDIGTARRKRHHFSRFKEFQQFIFHRGHVPFRIHQRKHVHHRRRYGTEICQSLAP